jgi:hypothetical protein
MAQSRRSKREEEGVLPGPFQNFEAFNQRDPALQGWLGGTLRRGGGTVQVGQVVLARDRPRRLSFAKLRLLAQRLSEQVDYLRERLEIVDHDRRGMLIQLRSLPPAKDDAGIEFNEICLGRDRLVVRRIAFTRREEVKREVPLQLTELELERLLGHLREAMA